MKKLNGKDKLFGEVAIRADGGVVHPMDPFEVKKPEESKYAYDYDRLISTIPADRAFRPLGDGECALSNEQGTPALPGRWAAGSIVPPPRVVRSRRWASPASRCRRRSAPA